MSQSLLIIDGFSLAFRAFYSFPTHLTDPNGNPINAVLGFVSLMFGQIDTLNPTHVCVCFDRKEPTFRHTLFSEYKGHRPPPPEEFKIQIPILMDLLDKLGIVRLDYPGYEADDLMGTLSKKATESNVQTYMMTGDHDTFQLINDYTHVVMQKKGQPIVVSLDNMMEIQGVMPHQIVDYKALKGDSSDNIPGVKGIGDKTAIQLLSEFKTLEGIYSSLDAVKSKSVREKLITNKDNAFLSQQLATITCDVPIEYSLDSFLFHPSWDSILSVFKEYQFQGLVKKYNSKKDMQPSIDIDSQSNTLSADGDYRCLKTIEEVSAFLPHLKKGFALDLETTSLSIHSAEIVGVSLSVQEREGVYIPLNEFLRKETALLLFEEVTPVEFELNPILALLKPYLEDASLPKYTHNGKYEYLVLRNYDITLAGIAFDTMLAAFLLFPGEKVGLKDVVYRQLSIEMTTYEAVTGTGKSQLNFRDVPLDVATQYAAADADFTFRLTKLFTPELEHKQVVSLFNDIEVPLQNVLAKMEETGVAIDLVFLKQLEREFQEKSKTLSVAIIEKAGVSFNINSTKQLAEVLYDTLGLPVLKKTKTGRSTDSSVLEKLAEHHPIASDILEYRLLEKLLSTYVKALPEIVSKKTNRIHTSFNQTIAITGRLSSTSPNLQNIPIRTKEGQRIRGAFIASSPDHELFSADYSQIELRIMAHLSQDKTMMNSFLNGEDIHSSTAALIHNVALDDVTKEQRYAAKAVNFGILYGQSAFGLSEQLSIGRAEAKEIIDHYFETFPSIRAFMEETIAFVKEHKYVRTEFGRIRPIMDIDSRLFQRRQFAERIAINTRVQGTAADIIKIAMNNIDKTFEQEKLQSKMIIQVHDELVFDVLKTEKETVFSIVKEAMESVVDLRVPLVVDTVFGKTWEECM